MEFVNEHVENLDWNDEPDLVVIQVYITIAYRAYKIADHFRAREIYFCLGGLHVTHCRIKLFNMPTRSLSARGGHLTSIPV